MLDRKFLAGVWGTAMSAGLLVSVANAAIGDHQWSAGFGSEGGEVGVDGSGNIVAHGTFFGSVNFGGGSLNSVNFFDGDQYLARFDAQGNHQWSVQFSPVGPGASNEEVAVDPAGNIYIAGSLFTNTTIDYGGGVLTGDGLYVAKFNSSGVHQWSTLHGSGKVTSITADNSHVVITGYTSAGIDFGGGTVGTGGGRDAFVAQFTSAGTHAWSSGFGDASDQGGMAAAIDGSGNVILAGSMEGTADFGGGPLVANGLDLFVASFSSGGVHSWSQVFDGIFTPGGGVTIGVDVSTGPAGQIAVAGELIGSTDFGGGTVTSNGFGDVFVALFDAGGSHQWSAVYGNANGSDLAQAASIDGAGNVLVSGRFFDDTDFGGGVVPFDGDPLFERNIFLAVYDPAGAHLFSRGYGPQPSVAESHFDPSDDILVYGPGGSNLDLGGGPLSPASFFLAKMQGAGQPTSVGDDVLQPVNPVQAAPNPLQNSTRVDYTLKQEGPATLYAFDIRGRPISALVSRRWHAAGQHSVQFDPPGSGVYFIKLQAGEVETVLKVVSVR